MEHSWCPFLAVMYTPQTREAPHLRVLGTRCLTLHKLPSYASSRTLMPDLRPSFHLTFSPTLCPLSTKSNDTPYETSMHGERLPCPVWIISRLPVSFWAPFPGLIHDCVLQASADGDAAPLSRQRRCQRVPVRAPHRDVEYPIDSQSNPPESLLRSNSTTLESTK